MPILEEPLTFGRQLIGKIRRSPTGRILVYWHSCARRYPGSLDRRLFSGCAARRPGWRL